MLDFSPEKMVMIFLIILIVLGPEKMPEVARKIGKATAELKKLSGGFQEEIRSAVTQATTEPPPGDVPTTTEVVAKGTADEEPSATAVGGAEDGNEP